MWASASRRPNLFGHRPKPTILANGRMNSALHRCEPLRPVGPNLFGHNAKANHTRQRPNEFGPTSMRAFASRRAELVRPQASINCISIQIKIAWAASPAHAMRVAIQDSDGDAAVSLRKTFPGQG